MPLTHISKHDSINANSVSSFADPPDCLNRLISVADDKLIYAHVPAMIHYYLGEEPIIENVPTYLCSRESERQYVLDHLEHLVVKSVAEAGGYGMLIGAQASRSELSCFDAKIRANPRNSTRCR